MKFKNNKRFLPTIPTKEELLAYRSLKWFKFLLNRPYLWHWERRNVSNASAIAMLCAFTPWPLQMIQATIMAIIFRTHLPIAITGVWITNPITMPFIFYFAYLIGAQLLGVEMTTTEFELSWSWLSTFFIQIWKPFLLGCLICGVTSAIILRYTVSFFWKYITKYK